MSRPMTFGEFGILLKHIAAEHSPFNYKSGLMVKYIDPHFDMRMHQVFSITFRTFGAGEITLHCQNECSQLKDDLFTRCMAALQKEPSHATDKAPSQPVQKSVEP